MVSAIASAVNVFPTPGGPLSWIIIPLPTNVALVGTLISPVPRCGPKGVGCFAIGIYGVI